MQADLGSGETPHFLVYDGCLLIMPSHSGRGEGTLLDLFCKNTNPILESSTSMT